MPKRMLSGAAVVAAIAAAGCGSSSNTTTTTTTSAPAAAPAATSGQTTSSPSAASSVSVEANREGQLKYVQSTLSATAGNVTIAFTNMAPLAHNVTVANAAGTIVGATPTFQGGSKSVTLSLRPGVYKFYCSVPGHRAAGMEGTLVVH